MNFINPIEILDLQNYTVSVIDKILIKRQKRILYADIDLSDDGLLDYKGILLTKSDCEKAIDTLDNPGNIALFLYLAKDNLPLNDFLLNVDERFFSTSPEDYIYNVPEFVNFISPYFAPRFDKTLLNAFTAINSVNFQLKPGESTIEYTKRISTSHQAIVSKLKSILQMQILIAPRDINTAFKSLSVEIENRINQTETLVKKIKDKTTDYTDKTINEVVNLVKKLFPEELLNLLPPYFLSQINKIADSINFLQVGIWDTFKNSSVCMSLLTQISDLKVESVHKQTFENNYRFIKKKYDEKQVEEKRKEEELKAKERFQNYSEQLLALVNSFENKSKNIANAIHLLDQAKPILFNIKSISKDKDSTYIRLSTHVASVALGFVMKEVSYSKTPYNKSLNTAWKAMQLIGALEMENDFMVNRYIKDKKSLLSICSKLNIETPEIVLKMIPKSNFIIIDGTITHTNKEGKSLSITNPFIKGDIRYIGLTLKVETSGYQYIQFYLKYIQPDGAVITGLSSPKGYTLSNNTFINSNTKIINFIGWGNDEKGIYEIGTHYIEVWVESCMIYRKSFEVDWSKEEKERIIAENRKQEKREAEKRDAEQREQEQVRKEAEKRNEQAKIEAQKAKDIKVRNICLWIILVFIGLAVFFTIWGKEGFIVLLCLTGLFAILVVIAMIIRGINKLK